MEDLDSGTVARAPPGLVFCGIGSKVTSPALSGSSERQPGGEKGRVTSAEETTSAKALRPEGAGPR